MGVTMDVGQGFLHQPIDRAFDRSRHRNGLTVNIERDLDRRTAAESLDQRS
jgi:hypothetical protein